MNKLVYKYLEQYKSLSDKNILLSNSYDFSDKSKRKKLLNNQNHLVFANGNKNAKIYIVLESFNNDSLSVESDLLLDKILKSINLSKEEVFRLDFFKKQPMTNSNDYIEEINLDVVFSANKPDLIIAMGDLAAKVLLLNEKKIDSFRNKVHNYHGIDLIVTYHPNDLILKPKFKRPTWEDFKFIRDKYFND